MTNPAASLFQPFESANLQLKNRILMAPMTRNFCPGGVPGPASVEYYRKRAAGGVGLLITEGTIINHPAASGYPDVPWFYGPDALQGWRAVVDAVHQAGSKIFPQLWHVGSVREPGLEPNPEVKGYGPSAVLHPVKKEGTVPHAMSQADIDAVVAAYAQAAKDAMQLGFDGIEIHGAHGYLIDQFFWEASNQRTDNYGGSLANRVRFAQEIIQAVRAATGPDFPIMLRFSQWKMGAYTAKLVNSPTELEAFLQPLTEAGVDLFHCSTRRFYQSEFEGSDLNLAGWTRKISGKPCVTVGSVGLKGEFLRAFMGKSAPAESLDELLRRLDANEFDLVAVGRALISDPDWAHKVEQDRFADIKGFDSEDLKTLQ
ncbi:MAG: NADH:flavin oxidoreductase [Leptospiraceae bacterium]|nr:NADH:flavin oxidoreductase [Leptospiraceae bacterium]